MKICNPWSICGPSGYVCTRYSHSTRGGVPLVPGTESNENPPSQPKNKNTHVVDIDIQSSKCSHSWCTKFLTVSPITITQQHIQNFVHHPQLDRSRMSVNTKYVPINIWDFLFGGIGGRRKPMLKLNQVTGYNINSKSCITPRFGEWCARVRRCSSCFVGTGWTLCLIGSSTYFSADSEWRMIIKNARTHTR